VSTRPLTLTVAAVVLGLEGLTALVLGCYVAVETVIGEPADLSSSIGVAVIGVLAGAGLLWVAWGALQTARWCRSPGVLTQILALPVAVTLIQSGSSGLGILLIAAAVIALVTLLAPPSTHAMYDEEHTDR
jgi:hypothetical protein